MGPMLVLTTGQLPDGALLGGDPGVAGPRVEDHVELLPRRPDLDGSVVLGLCSQINYMKK
jgi:hypothetical protein